MTADDEIRDLLTNYETALNSDTALSVRCYARDGMFLPTTLPTLLAGAVSLVIGVVRHPWRPDVGADRPSRGGLFETLCAASG